MYSQGIVRENDKENFVFISFDRTEFFFEEEDKKNILILMNRRFILSLYIYIHIHKHR